MAEINPPTFMAGGCYEAVDHRRLWGLVVCDEGVRNVGGVGTDLRVGTSGSAARTVLIAAGEAFIQGDDIADQGVYHVINDATASLQLAAPGPTDTRIDLIVARVRDGQYVGGGTGWALEVVPGSPGPNPQIPNLPNSAIPLAAVTMAPGTTMLQPGMVEDLRTPWAYCSDTGRVLTSGQDLNLYVTPGVFFAETDAIAASIANWPTGHASGKFSGMLEVFVKPGFTSEVIQRVTESSRNDFIIWERHRTGTGWGAWRPLNGPGRWATGAFVPSSAVTAVGPNGGGDSGMGARFVNGGVELAFRFDITSEITANANGNFSPDIVLGSVNAPFRPRANTDLKLTVSGAATVFARLDGVGSSVAGELALTHGTFPGQTFSAGTTFRVSAWYPSWVDRL